jgi:carboxymethylenebutenolidase
MHLGEAIRYPTPARDSEAPGVLFRLPGDAPGVVLIQEWWGLNDQIRGVAARLAAAGYSVLIPDLYRGRATAVEDEARHLMTALDFDAAMDDITGAAAHLRALGAPKVGVMGFCMGGALTIAALSNRARLDAGVCFYGVPGPARADPAQLSAPLQCHFAEIDDWCTPAVVGALEDRLRSGRTEYELYRYDARHGFFNETRPGVHDPAASAAAWRRTLDFLHRHLGGPAPRSAA